MPNAGFSGVLRLGASCADCADDAGLRTSPDRRCMNELNSFHTVLVPGDDLCMDWRPVGGGGVVDTCCRGRPTFPPLRHKFSGMSEMVMVNITAHGNPIHQNH
jgi:hypothetical protein